MKHEHDVSAASPTLSKFFQPVSQEAVTYLYTYYKFCLFIAKKNKDAVKIANMRVLLLTLDEYCKLPEYRKLPKHHTAPLTKVVTL